MSYNKNTTNMDELQQKYKNRLVTTKTKTWMSYNKNTTQTWMSYKKTQQTLMSYNKNTNIDELQQKQKYR